MKKKFLYTAIFAAIIGLASCNEDFNADVAAPQTWEQEEILAASGMTITPAADINLETVTEDSVILFSYQVNNQVEGSKIENLTAYVSKQDVEEWRKIEVDAEGKASVEVLQKTIEDLYGKKDENGKREGICTFYKLPNKNELDSIFKGMRVEYDEKTLELYR